MLLNLKRDPERGRGQKMSEEYCDKQNIKMEKRPPGAEENEVEEEATNSSFV